MTQKIPPEAASGTMLIGERETKALRRLKTDPAPRSWTVEIIENGQTITSADVPAVSWWNARDRFAHVVGLEPHDPRIRATENRRK